MGKAGNDTESKICHRTIVIPKIVQNSVLFLVILTRIF